MTSRRSFLASVLSTGGVLTLPRVKQLAVEAAPTVFYSHSNNLVLVRFTVTGTDAPAGRLRVYDRSRRFLGTAGVIATTGRLYGEFWVPVDGVTSISTDLELPGRSPLRTNHRLVPQKKWTLHWTTIATADEVENRLGQLSPEDWSVEIDMLRNQRFLINPIPDSHLDSRQFDEKFRYLADSFQAARALGIAQAEVAFLDTRNLSASLPVLMLASGTRFAITRGSDPAHWIEGPGGSRILSRGRGRGNPTDLGFDIGTNAMTSLIERFLDRQDDPISNDVLVASNLLGENRETVLMNVEDWNGRFAYPRIEMGDGTQFFETLATPGIPIIRIEPTGVPIPDAASLWELADLRTQTVAAAGARLLEAAGRADGHVDSLDFVTNLSLPTPGLLVLNATPFTRSDVVRKPDGEEFVATNIPAMGYAYIPGTPSVTATATSSDLSLDANPSIIIDPSTGAIKSIVDADGNEWVRPGGSWNSLVNTQLQETIQETIPELGTRFRLRRWSSARGDLETTITVYDDLPWIDISNDCEGVGSRPIEYGFDFNIDSPAVHWDLTVNSVESNAPVERMRHDRFVTISHARRTVNFRCFDSPYFSINEDATLTSFAPKDICGFRISCRTGLRLADDSHRFGWSGDPLQCLAVEGRGQKEITSFGSLVATDRADVLLVGLRQAENGQGMIAYLQDVGGVGGNVVVSGGVMTFREAHRCDLLERNMGDPSPVIDGKTTVRIEPHGISAVRLLGLSLLTP